MTTAVHNTQQLILSAASLLTADQFETYQRLCKRLVHGPKFQLLIIDCRDERLQKQLQQLLTEVCQQAGLAATTLKADGQIADVFALQQQFISLANEHAVIQLISAANWFATAGRFAEFNLLRENIASQAQCRLIFWLNEESIAAMIEQAPDWWAWRGGVYTFDALSKRPNTRPTPEVHSLTLRHQHKDQAARRIATLTTWLQSPEAIDPELTVALWFELSNLYEQLGEWDQALHIYQNECLPRFHQLSDLRNEAMTQGQIAEILMLKGQYTQALQIRENKELPTYQMLGDQRDITLTQGKIADIFFRMGMWKQAEYIWREVVIPVMKQLDDAREVAIFKGKIADILIARRQFDEALKLLKEAIPELEKTGDIRSAAINQGKIAEILLQQGEFKAALTTIKSYELPVYQKLGDTHSLALTKAGIADILAAQGQFSEAIQLLQFEALPELQKLGDVQSEAAIKSKIADILSESGDLERALKIYQSEILPVVLKLQIPIEIRYAQIRISEIKQELTKTPSKRN